MPEGMREPAHVHAREAESARLQRAVDKLKDAADPDLDWLRAAIEAREPEVRRALGLTRRGGVSDDMAERLRRRDDGLRELARLAGRRGGAATPAELLNTIKGYEPSFRRDAEAGKPPADPVRRQIFDILNTGAKLPKRRRLTEIIKEAAAGGNPIGE